MEVLSLTSPFKQCQGKTSQPEGYKDKAAKANYEVAVRKCVGAGRKARWLLPQGAVVPKVRLMRARFADVAEVFWACMQQQRLCAPCKEDTAVDGEQFLAMHSIRR